MPERVYYVEPYYTNYYDRYLYVMPVTAMAYLSTLIPVRMYIYAFHSRFWVSFTMQKRLPFFKS